MREAFNDAASDSDFFYGVFFFPGRSSGMPDPPLGSPTHLLLHTHKKKNREKRGERTRRIDSKHNRMWYRVCVSLPNPRSHPNTLHPSIFAPPPSFQESCMRFFFFFFFLFSISDFVFHRSQRGLSRLKPTAATLMQVCNSGYESKSTIG